MTVKCGATDSGSNLDILDGDLRKFFLRHGILLGFLTTWLKNGKQESVEELLNILKLCTQFIQESELII